MIRSQPQNVQILWGCTTRLNVIACGAVPLCYQWYFESQEMPGMLNYIVAIHSSTQLLFIGQNNSMYFIYSATKKSAGHYYCQIKNRYGEVISTIAVVTVTLPTYFPLKSISMVFNKELSMYKMQDSTSLTDLQSKQ